MMPVNFLNRSLIRYALCKREGSVRNLRRRVSMNESQNSGVRSVSLCHCERDRGDGHKQKQAKHAPTGMRLDLLASVRFHFIPAPVGKHPVLKTRQRCQDKFVPDAHRDDERRFGARADEKLTRFSNFALLIAFGSLYHRRPNGNTSKIRSTPR
jgi:hypothetical protein